MSINASMKLKWVFMVKEEEDGLQRFKSRIVQKGCVMIPSVDYTESFLPVAADTMVRMAIVMALYSIFKWGI